MAQVAQAGIDYELNQSFAMAAICMDSGSPVQSMAWNFTVDVVNQNERPTSISLSNSKESRTSSLLFLYEINIRLNKSRRHVPFRSVFIDPVTVQHGLGRAYFFGCLFCCCMWTRFLLDAHIATVCPKSALVALLGRPGIWKYTVAPSASWPVRLSCGHLPQKV